MKLENQVCTVGQAKMLKELGVIQKSIFIQGLNNGDIYFGLQSYNPEYVSLFTVAELGVMLPNGEYDTCQWDYGWRVYDSEGDDALGEDDYFPTEAQARAAMLIYLLENKHITSDEVNERLLNA